MFRRYLSIFSRSNRTHYVPEVIVEASGSKVRSASGKYFLDLSSSGATMIVGYNHPKVVEAVCSQARRVLHYTYMYGMNFPALELGEKLLEITGVEDGKILYGLSGSDASESALMLVKAWSGNDLIVSFEGDFHGVFDLSASSSCIDLERQVCEAVNCGKAVACLPYPDPYRCPFGDVDDCGREAVKFMKAFVDELVEKRVQPAAFIVEPLQGDSGIVVPSEGFLREVKKQAERVNAPVIVDEIQTGLGRTGKWFAYQYDGIEPDLVLLGKPLGGGLPLSAVVGKAEIMDSLPTMSLAFTLSGNPVACSAGLATIRVIEEEGLVERAAYLGYKALKELRDFARKHPLVGDVRGKGLMIGVDLVKDPETKERAVDEAKKVVYRAYQLGVLVLSVNGNVLRIQPPINISEELLMEGINILEQAIEDVENGAVGDEALKVVVGW
ncbi:MAG: aminotransferase class III-fold pyridoxal phosphate-dependent enzyme [Desulfurococcales archaeon]|nr:aminotransferase class III-fold pyridoxal phosphate-dependent enzyme [Desulfurococcales archaeon]